VATSGDTGGAVRIVFDVLDRGTGLGGELKVYQTVKLAGATTLVARRDATLVVTAAAATLRDE